MLNLNLQNAPKTALELVQLIGFKPTVELVNNYGGLTLRIPLGVSPKGREFKCKLRQDLGVEAADKVIRQYGGTELYVPNCKSLYAAARADLLNSDRDGLAKQGLSERAIVMQLACKYKVSDRYVWTLLKKPRVDALKVSVLGLSQGRLI